MDYIRKQIDQRIDFLHSLNDKSALVKHFQARLEYVLVYLLAYLWNKNLNRIDDEDREFVFQNVIKPTIGNIVAICRKLDVNKEIFKKNKLSKALDKYPAVRNELLGHGFVYEDNPDKLLSPLQEFYDSVLFTNLPILKEEVDFVYVNSLEENNYKGISYKSDGLNYTAWSCPKNTAEFKLKSIYGCYLLSLK